MHEFRNGKKELIDIVFDLEDLEVGGEYLGNCRIEPHYLENGINTVVKKGKKNVFITNSEHGDQQYSVHPSTLKWKDKPMVMPEQ